MPETVRYVVTHVRQRGPMEGHRGLTFAAQGRYTFETPEAAQEWIESARKNNSPSTMAMYGTPDTLQVRACLCFPYHHDPMQVWFD